MSIMIFGISCPGGNSVTQLSPCLSPHALACAEHPWQGKGSFVGEPKQDPKRSLCITLVCVHTLVPRDAEMSCEIQSQHQGELGAAASVSASAHQHQGSSGVLQEVLSCL